MEGRCQRQRGDQGQKAVYMHLPSFPGLRMSKWETFGHRNFRTLTSSLMSFSLSDTLHLLVSRKLRCRGSPLTCFGQVLNQDPAGLFPQPPPAMRTILGLDFCPLGTHRLTDYGDVAQPKTKVHEKQDERDRVA